MSDFERKLARELQSQGEEYRSAYAEAFANELLATQIQMLRKKLGLTQSQLGERIGTSQARMSNYEDEDYGKWSMETLRKLAREFGLWPKITFESYGTLIRDVAHFSPAALSKPPFPDDPDIHRLLGGEFPADFYSQLKDWLAQPAPDLTRLAAWLQGQNLPGFDPNQATLVQFLSESLPPADTETTRRLGEQLAKLISQQPQLWKTFARHPAILLDNAFGLARSLGPQAVLQEALDNAFQMQAATPSLTADALTSLTDAMIHNQVDSRWRPVWWSFLTSGKHSVLPGKGLTGIRGACGLPAGPDYWLDLARAIRDLEISYLSHARTQSNLIKSVTAAMNQLIVAMEVVFQWAPDVDTSRQLYLASERLLSRREGVWNHQSLSAWAVAVEKRGWTDVLLASPDHTQRRALANAIETGNSFFFDWHSKCSLPVSEVYSLNAKKGSRVANADPIAA